MWASRHAILAVKDTLSVPTDVRAAFDPCAFTVYALRNSAIAVLSNTDAEPYELYTTVDTVRRHPDLIASLVSRRHEVTPDTARDVWGPRDGRLAPLAMDMATASPFPAPVRVATYNEDDAVRGDFSSPVHVANETVVCVT